ncbi:MAG: universal stress protein [Leptolyngbya sp. Prado105]|jgi:nucleotide-binding universal stress UspA family protein|nr:universal stress protein [Leptolyngbya sp. Prado105]
MFHKILVAIDDSELSQIVFEQTLALAKENQADLLLLHVLEPFEDSYPGDPYMGISDSAKQAYLKHWKEWEQTGIDRLKLLEERATAAGVSTEFTQSLGHPGKVICALAKTWNADLIVVGRRGFKGLQEFWIGSVSNYVLHHAPCHVLTLQGNIQVGKMEDAIAAYPQR